MVHDLAGSYEQAPPHLLAELQRDRRWCQGNLQNARLVAEPGLHAVHRALLATGALAYVSAPLWLLYLVLGAGLWWLDGSPAAAPGGPWAAGVPGLWIATIGMLALPRVLGVLAIVLRREQAAYGGGWRLVLSVLLEAGLSLLQAPLRMVAHTLFVVGALGGWRLQWTSPPRRGADIGWREAAQRFAPASLGVVAIAAALWLLNPSALPWLIPVGLPLLLAIPIATFTSRSSVGERWRSAGLLWVPEESHPPAVLRRAAVLQRRAANTALHADPADTGRAPPWNTPHPDPFATPR
jgi:membrane glycosyltransferase